MRILLKKIFSINFCTLTTTIINNPINLNLEIIASQIRCCEKILYCKVGKKAKNGRKIEESSKVKNSRVAGVRIRRRGK